MYAVLHKFEEIKCRDTIVTPSLQFGKSFTATPLSTRVERPLNVLVSTSDVFFTLLQLKLPNDRQKRLYKQDETSTGVLYGRVLGGT